MKKTSTAHAQGHIEFLSHSWYVNNSKINQFKTVYNTTPKRLSILRCRKRSVSGKLFFDKYDDKQKQTKQHESTFFDIKINEKYSSRPLEQNDW